MKRFISIFTLLAFAPFALGVLFIQPSRFTTAAGGDITVQLWQTFEGALDASGLAANDNHASATWTVTGDGKTVETVAERATVSTVNTVADSGTQGLQVVNSTGTGSVRVDTTNYATTQSVGFWFRVTALTDSTYAVGYAAGEGILSGTAIITLRMSRSGSAYTILLHQPTTPADSGTVSVSIDTWYWISIKVVRNGTCLLRVYDTSSALVGSEQSLAGSDYNFWYHYFPGASGSATGNYYIDDFVINNDTAPFPLGP